MNSTYNQNYTLLIIYNIYLLLSKPNNDDNTFIAEVNVKITIKYEYTRVKSIVLEK